MWLPQRFKRLPSEEIHEGRAIQMPAYPSRVDEDSKKDIKDNSHSVYRPVHTDTEYSAGSQNTATYTISHPRRIAERFEDEEHRRFGTRRFGTFYDTFIGGWRAGLIRAFLFSLATLLVNIAIYAWLFDTYNTMSGTATVRTGSCTMIRASNTAVHAALNVASTLILGASTYAMQGLTAPSRKEVDRAHANGKWVEIGTQSVRNLFHVRRRHMWIWLVLGITSLPYHLFFNAVFFTTTQANQYAVAVVDQTILSGSTFQPSTDNSSPALFEQYVSHSKDCDDGICSFDNTNNETAVFDLLRDITNSSDMAAAGFARMEPLECIRNYTSGFLRQWGDVAVVSSQFGSESPVLYTRYPQRSVTLNKEKTNQDPFHWICHDILKPNSTSDDDVCSQKLAMSQFAGGKNWTVYGHPVSHCLARRVQNVCELQFNAFLMVAVVVAGGIKTIVIAYLLFAHPKGSILRTLGDAISSYLQEPDTTTQNMCLISSSEIRKHGFKPPYSPQIHTHKRPHWLSSANTLEFSTTVAVSAFYIISLSIALYFGVDGARGLAFSNGLGVPDIQSLARFQADDTGSSGIVPTLLVANVPQVGFSILYVVYTSIWGKLLVSHEFDRMTTSRKGLRVSERPKGMQRPTHFFNFPARYAFPLMACSAGLHWLCSQSFFMVRIDGVDATGHIDPDDRLVRLGYSARGVVALIALSVALLVATVCAGLFRRLNTRLGETSMSIVISAACHAEREEVTPWLGEVMWGDVGVGGHGHGDGVRRAAFSSGLVEGLRVGSEYS